MKTPQATPRKRQSAAKANPGNSSAADAADTPSGRGIDPDQRMQMVARAAYFRAQQRGFAPGHELEDWLDAEAEIDDAMARKMH